MIASDVVAVGIGFATAIAIQQVVRPVSVTRSQAEALFGVIIVPIWVLMMGANHLFLARAVTHFSEEFRHLLTAGLMAIGFLVGVLFIAQYHVLSRLWAACSSCV